MSGTIRFDDGAAYERTMGRWSEIAGAIFLEWLAPPNGAAWLDIGCGTGAFTRMVARSCAPSALAGIDPSAAQLAFARQVAAPDVPTPCAIDYREARAEALPYPPASFDQAVMALVIFFVADPAAAVAEMARVLRPGGTASAYAWQATGYGAPTGPLQQALEAHGHTPPAPPNAAASGQAEMRALWSAAGFTGIETREITAEMRFDSFAEYWAMMRQMPRVAGLLAELGPAEEEAIRLELLRRIAPNPAAATAPVVATARANAIKGHRPA